MRHGFGRRQRGAAMVEFVLLMPVILGMWMGIEYFRSGYARRLDALGKAGTQAWASAMTNDMSCYKGGLKGGGIAGLAAGSDQGQKAVDQYAANSNSSMFMYADVGSQKSQSTRTAGWDKTKGNVAGRAFVACNEVVPKAGDDDNILVPLKSFISGVFPSF